MRSRVHARQGDQLKLFHPPRRRPTWRGLPEKVRQRTQRLLAQMLREEVARNLGGDSLMGVGDE